MAEIITKTGKNRKPQIRVDMTPLVDLGFLLITFFMFTTNFSKPNVMDLGLPAKEQKPPTAEPPKIDVKNQLTLILGKDNRIFYYQKELKDLTKSDIKETSMQGLAVAKLIESYKKIAPKAENFTVIIKPTDEANYKNFVDILDEMAISKHERYGISDIKTQEKTFYEEIIK
ncbi:MAG: biopolymer transporter ExbD [Flavobacteriaceae bacterium]|jgi:biopolymer transport protein ExbD|nr:biopolymer transporter ExbD [Flavobacteriaceae bacterium]